MTWTAECACGRLQVTIKSEPTLVVACHCDFCQKRSGSPFPVAMCWASSEELEVRGEAKVYNGLEIEGVGDVSGESVSYPFCPTCGSTVFWIREDSELIAIAVGNLAGPVPAPTIEIHVDNCRSWILPIQDAEQFGTSPEV